MTHDVTVLVVGSGGREHAIASKIAQSQHCKRLLVAPGNAGTPGERHNVAVTDVQAMVALCAQQHVDLVIIGPEAALDAGLTDALLAINVKVFGPTQHLSVLESSKVFSRQLAQQLNLPSPHFAHFSQGNADAAIAWCATFDRPVVVKQSGLAGGKGVVVPETIVETHVAIREAIAVGDIVLEERLVGTEVSLIALCDGITSVALPLAQDHKRVGEGDTGANTGGMGAYAPAPVNTTAAALHAEFIAPVINHFAKIGTPYMGALFAGIMLTADGPRLLEFNCRFGDPEAQVLLALIENDFVELMLACATSSLASSLMANPLRIKDASALGVVIAADGYPHKIRTGDAISDIPQSTPIATVYHGATELVDNKLVSKGGRVLTCVGIGPTLEDARTHAYAAASRITLRGSHMRRDIAWRAPGATIHSYASTGVNIDEGTRAVSLIKTSVEKTASDLVLRGVGAFGGALDVSFLKKFDHPVLVGSTDGVGTKVELAARTGRIRGTGHDIVNHCVNDVLVQRAYPLFFLDYLASSHIDAEMVAEVVGGMADACAAAGCVLLGGETAEMPGVYAPGAFDIAGTLVGVAERDQLLPLQNIQDGDVLIGVLSNGPHTNGYSYLRKLFAWIPLESQPAPLDKPLVEALLMSHRNYLPVLKGALDTELVKALVHITGGGLPDNMPRVLPDGVGAKFNLGSWPMPPLFQLVQQLSALDTDELYRTLNMGIGMVLVVDPSDVSAVQSAIDEPTFIIGCLVHHTSNQHSRVSLS
jgi:phosphoribosylamine--glycine ligase/phosphoribosylaminoimidazole synthetase